MGVRWRARAGNCAGYSGILPPKDYIIGGVDNVEEPSQNSYPIICKSCGKSATLPFEPKPGQL